MGMEQLLRELNPKYDLARHTYTRGDSLLRELKEIGFFTLNVGKSVVRGSSTGAVIGLAGGTIYGLINNDVPNGLEFGVPLGIIYGSGIDATQYLARFCISRIKNDYLDIREDFRKIKEEYKLRKQK